MGRLEEWKARDSDAPGPGQRLDSWKEIAAYFNRGVRTAQEWERHEGMPVHRQRHARRCTVYAIRHELDAWWQSRREDLGGEEPAAPILLIPLKRLSRRLALAAGLVAIAVLAGVTGWYLALNTTSREPLRAVPFTTYPGQEWLPALSPDGDRVAFVWTGANQDNMDIYVRSIGSDVLTRLTEHPANDWAPAWSPDGEQIAFLRTLANGVIEMILIPAAGGSEENIGEVLGPVGFVEACLLVGPYLTWTSDGRFLIVVDRDSIEEPHAIFALNLDTWEKHRLTQPPSTAIGDSGPALSADGRTLAFHRLMAEETSHLFVLDLTEDLKPAGEPTQLTFAAQLHMSPVWLEGDREILYTAGPSREAAQLWRLEVSSPSRRRELAGAGAWGVTPTVSHAARRMLYSEYRYIRNVWRIDLAGDPGSVGRVFAELNSTLFDGSPSWSPDGQKIALVSDRSGQRAIWLFAGDGTGDAQLTDIESRDVVWSPDGRSLAFVCRDGGSDNICVIDVRGGQPTMLTSDAGNDADPHWSADGRWIYFTSDREGSLTHWKVPARGGSPTVTGLPIGSRESPDGECFYYDGGDGLWRVGNEDEPPQRIVEARSSVSAWKITSAGVYYVEGEVPCCVVPGASPEDSGRPFMFHDFASGQAEQVAFLGGYQGGAIDLSPDRSAIMYTRQDGYDVDLMLVEDFQ